MSGMPRHPDRVKLLFGPYTPPPLRKGDRASCLYRDADVVVTGWRDDRIPWPRCRALDSRGHGSGLLVEEELARAVRSESAAAVMYWWGISCSTVWLWRTALGVEGWTATEGTRRLMRGVWEKAAASTRGKSLPPEQVERRRRTALELDLGRHLKRAREARAWPAWQLELLGTALDEEVAQRIGRSAGTVRRMRAKRGIPNPSGPSWTPEQVEPLGTAPDEEVAARICRTAGAVGQKRCLLGIPTFRDRRFKKARP
jgi:hypothetical protein